jgi:2-dehydro-3-deoxyphosphogalactonate aldolase
MKAQFEKYMAECPAVAILRGILNEEVPAICDALYEGGIRLLEIPLNSPNAVESIAIAARHCEGRQMVGAGTVLTPEDVIAVYKAGGKYICSPNTDCEVIKETKRLGLISIPGFFTATEGFAASKAGSDYLKLFPAILGSGYVKDLKAVIKLPIMAVGGVNAANTPEFLKVCCGVGIGSAVYKAGRTASEVGDAAKEITSSIR